jgi:general nucleoside transport system permease protein
MLPTFQIEDREEVSRLFSFLVLLLSLLAGFAAVGLVFALAGANPFFAIEKIFAGSFGSVYGLKETLSKAIPLILIGAGLTFAFRGRFWNIGAESQLLFGAIFGTWVGLGFGPSLPGPLGLVLMFAAGFLGGALWAAIPVFLKIKFGINEVISTLMFNYVAAEFTNYLVVGPWRGATKHGYPYTDDLAKNVVLDLLPASRVHYATLVLGILLCVLLFILLFKSKLGYEVRVAGESPEAAKYAGISFFRTSLLVMVISGGAAGLAGVGEVAGVHHHLSYPGNISAGYGFTAIIVAWLAKLNPLLVIVSGFFFAGILVGGDAIQISLGFPAATVNVFNGIILFFLIGGDYFLKNRVSLRFRKGKN